MKTIHYTDALKLAAQTVNDAGVLGQMRPAEPHGSSFQVAFRRVGPSIEVSLCVSLDMVPDRVDGQAAVRFQLNITTVFGSTYRNLAESVVFSKLLEEVVEVGIKVQDAIGDAEITSVRP